MTFSIPRLSMMKLNITTLRIISVIATMPIDPQHIGRIRDTQNTEIKHNGTKYNNTQHHGFNFDPASKDT
jgi:hypothetical protein